MNYATYRTPRSFKLMGNAEKLFTLEGTFKQIYISTTFKYFQVLSGTGSVNLNLNFRYLNFRYLEKA